jgi:hypothetical protein
MPTTSSDELSSVFVDFHVNKAASRSASTDCSEIGKSDVRITKTLASARFGWWLILSFCRAKLLFDGDATHSRRPFELGHRNTCCAGGGRDTRSVFARMGAGFDRQRAGEGDRCSRPRPGCSTYVLVIQPPKFKVATSIDRSEYDGISVSPVTMCQRNPRL